MNFKKIENEYGCYLDGTSLVGVLSSEKDVIELVSACLSSGTGSLLLHERSVSLDFFRLRTGLAGAALNKFQIYNIKTALIVEDTSLLEGRFGEMVLESNKGNDFRVYDSVQAAEEWLLPAV
ncbi:hypothetical protein C808_03641 [Lachnospiraceae bacterium M18-1]|nr:hypothetical protein C808_03641 [Lachnospiraceae bacterium M18-1]